MSLLNDLVNNFRSGIEKAIDSKEEAMFFKKFPIGQCGTTSDMLAQYLIDNGFNHIEYVNGTFYGDHSEDCQAHTWLDVDGIIVDITGDQFKNHTGLLHNTKSVYVGPMNEYYRLFECHPSGRHIHIGLEEKWTNYYELRRIYETIIEYIE